MKCRALKDILEKDVDKSYDLNPELCKGLVLKESTGPQYGKIEILGHVRNKKNQSLLGSFHTWICTWLSQGW